MAYSQSDTAHTFTLYCGERHVKNVPLYVIVKPGRDIIYYSVSEIRGINPSDIIKLEVLKKPKKIRKYGEKAKFGVILVTLTDSKLKEIRKSKKG
ncbi:MAG TPA: hypothetical protein VGD22_18065 [Sphingobacteriaceae bacterium]